MLRGRRHIWFLLRVTQLQHDPIRDHDVAVQEIHCSWAIGKGGGWQRRLAERCEDERSEFLLEDQCSFDFFFLWQEPEPERGRWSKGMAIVTGFFAFDTRLTTTLPLSPKPPMQSPLSVGSATSFPLSDRVAYLSGCPWRTCCFPVDPC